MADFRLGRLKFNWRGDWQVATAYVIDDIVKFGANTYVCVSNHTSVSNEAQWYSGDGARWQVHTEGIFNRGDWADATFYRLNDIVKYGNDQYRVIVAHTSDGTFASANFISYVNGLKFEDSWDTNTEYQSGDIVTFGGYSYVALETSTGSAPNNLGSSWEILTTGFKVVGTWSSSTAYKPGDVVLLGGNSYVAKTTNTNSTPADGSADWDFVVGGFTWRGVWSSTETYQPGDAISRASNSYICVAESTNNPPETDVNGDYWNSLTQGAQSNVLTDAGDVLYISGSGAARLPIGASGQVLTVDSNGYPAWEKSNATDPVYYVTVNGSDLNSGENITKSFASLRYALDNVTGPATIYVKAGTYNETLPMFVPENISIIGDNMRTTVIKPNIGANSSTQKLTLATVPDAALRVIGETCTNGAGDKTAQIIDVKDGGGTIDIMPITGGDWTLSDTFEAGVTDVVINQVAPILNENSTLFYLSSRSMLKDIVMDGMAGFVPSVSDPKDMNTATIEGVFVRLNPNSPITKSPYVSQCSAFSQNGVGAIVDGSVHNKYDGTATPSNKSIVFDSWTNIHENGGVGFWITNNGAAEIVSCFTYYCHISYTSTRGGRIRSLAGNSSWGTYAIVSSGFNESETTLDGFVDGLELNYDLTTLSTTSFDKGEQMIGGTSGAVGEVTSFQPSADKILFRPLKGTFVQNEVVTGQDSGATATLVNNSDAQKGQNGFTFVLGGMTSAPDPGGSIEYVTGPGGAGADQFTYVVANSSYNAPSGRGELTVTRGLLGSAAATHDGLSSITRYQTGTATSLSAPISSAVDTTIQVSSITGINTGGYIIIGNEMMEVVAFPTATSVTVVRGVEGTSASTHTSGVVVRALQIKVPGQTTTARDLTASDTIILVETATGTLSADFIKIDNEFMQVAQSATITTGTVTIVLAETKPTPSFDRQSTRVRYLYSQVRLTGHDFLDIGTGNKTQTNWPGLPLSAPAPGNEVTEDFPGRVFYVSTDQDGNFTVGRYFKVNQSTGSTTLNASSFDLSGLSSLRLGSIGAQIGESIDEFSSDVTLSANSNAKVPTQKAVKTYVDTKTKTKGFTFWAGAM
tara:strand:- start:17557 stop:20823 length:3267 start_codon:yes stop_codon:yes gene_type:complete